MVPPLITLEEHFFSQAVADTLNDRYAEQFKAIPDLRAQLTDLSTLRLQDMDSGRVSLQIVSHAPGTISPSQCRSANDQLAAAIKTSENRLAGFAVLPVASPKEAAAELERTVHTHGFVGALIDNHTADGTHYDTDDFDVLWSKFQELDVPCYLHPTWPSADMVPRYEGNFTKGAAMSMGASGWGWHSEVAMHVLRLHASGKFDKFPKLKIVIGHFGEMMPFMLQRISKLSVRWGDIKRPWKQVWDENIWITTSGVWSLDPMRTILANTKMDHILYSVDYPFEKNENGLKWMQDLEASGLVTREQLEMIAYQNAETLLRVKVPPPPSQWTSDA